MSMSDFLDDWFRDRSSKILQGTVCSIESFNQDKMTADVKPLLKKKIFGKTKAMPVIPDVPVSSYYCSDFIIKPDYKYGDLVWVSFSTHSIANAINGNMDISGDMFNAHDAVVIAGLQKGTVTLPAKLSLPGLVIGHKNGTALFHMEDGKIKLAAGAIDKSELTVLGETLKDWLDGLITDFETAAPKFTSNAVPGSPSLMDPDLLAALGARKAALTNILSQAVKIG